MPAEQLQNRRRLGSHHHSPRRGLRSGRPSLPPRRLPKLQPSCGSRSQKAPPLKLPVASTRALPRGTPRRQSARSSCGTRPRADVASPSVPSPGCHERQYRENVGSGLLRVASDRTDPRGNKAEAVQGRGQPASRSSSRVPEGSGNHKSTPQKTRERTGNDREQPGTLGTRSGRSETTFARKPRSGMGSDSDS
jgi:hypothetical protein